MLSRLLSFLKNLYDNRYMIKAMAKKDIKHQYTGSFLGMFWAVAHPVLMVMIYYAVFSFVFGPKVKGSYGNESFVVWLLCGLVPWFYFSNIVRTSAGFVVMNKALVTRTLFPSEVFPVISLISNLMSHIIGLVIIFISLAASGSLPGPYVLMIPVYFVIMCVMILGLSWIFSSLNVFVPDVGQILSLLMMLWYFATPIFWPVSILPANYKPLLYVNPLYHLVEGYRLCLMSGRLPELWSLLYLAGFSLFVFVAGGLLFKRLKPAFPDVL